jgi:hypothetical protein
MSALADQIGNHPVLLPLLDRLKAQGQQFGAPKSAAINMATIAWSRNSWAGFFLRDLDLDIGDGLLHPRRQLHRPALPAALWRTYVVIARQLAL